MRSPTRLLINAVATLLLIAANGSADAKKSEKALMKEARNLVRARRTNEAQPIYEQILRTNPKNVEAQAGLAWTLFAQGKHDEAETIAKKAIACDPKNPTAHNVLGAIYFSKGMVEEAKQEFRTVIKLDPNRRCGGCGDIRGLLGNDIPIRKKEKLKKKPTEYDPPVIINPGTNKKIKQSG